MTEGERRIYRWIERNHKSDGDPFRGAHTLKVYYQDTWPVCECCGQAVRVDVDTAYQMFCRATLKWDGKDVSHDELRDILLGLPSSIEDSQNTFRSASSYGLDPFREWGRRELGRNVVLADIDVALRRYGERFGLSADGDLMLIEKKERW